MTAVSVHGVTKRFESTLALDDVELRVGEGEVRGLLGPNGAGKTTLLRILFGLVRPDSGSVELLGRAPDLSVPGAFDGVAGFVEDPRFYPYLSARANLELLAELDRGAGRDRVGEALERVGLARRAEDRVNGYSTGMKQRLGIAASLLRGPRLLLLDEPTAGLDPLGVRDVSALVRELAAAGTAILLSSHQIDEVEEVCDGFTVLARGRVVWDGTAEALRAQAPAPDYEMETSDDARALEIAAARSDVRATATANGFMVTGEKGMLDHFVLALGHAGVAVRRLELVTRPLESMFFALTGERPGARPRSPLMGSAYRAESRKLASQLAIRVLALVCAFGPFVFVGILKVQSGAPTDTLYGVWVHSSGFAVSIVLLAFAGSWGFPIIAGIVAGDIFSAEDRYGTWKLVLTRSCTRGQVFWGKVLAAASFTVALALLTAVASLVAGAAIVGTSALVSLNGTVFTAAGSSASSSRAGSCACSPRWPSRASRCSSRSRPATGSWA